MTPAEKKPLSPARIFLLITIGALSGMVLGVLFGLGTGMLTPSFFAHFIPWNDVEPAGFAVTLGALGGLFLGGGLAVFSLVLHLLLRLTSRPKEGTDSPK